MTATLEGGEWSAARPGRTLPPGKTRYPLYRRLDGPQGRSGEMRKISPLTGIRSPDRPARSQLLYQLRYRAHLCLEGMTKKNSVSPGCMGCMVFDKLQGGHKLRE